MDVSQFLGGAYFSQVDLAQPIQLMTIGKVDQQLVGQGQQADQRICVTFNEFPQKPLALNKTNLTRVAELYSVQAEIWTGKQLQVYRSTTNFQGANKLCVRVCGAQQVPPDPICDPQGAPVLYQPPAAAVAPVQQVAPAAPVQQQPPVVAPVAAPVQEPPQQPPTQEPPWGG